MTTPEDRALAQVDQLTDPVLLRQMIVNARGQSESVVTAGLRRLASISTGHEAGTVECDCWAMIHTIEELRRLEGRTWRMNRLRKKIASDGEVEALRYCASKETEGFREVLGYGLPDLTAEAIIQRHPDVFDEAVRRIASARLADAIGPTEPAGAAPSVSN